MRRKRRYRTAVVPALLLLLALLAGCRGGEEPQTQEEESGYEIYYLNQTETGISGTAYEPAGASTGELVEEFLEQLAAVPADTELKPVLTQEIMVNGYVVENGQLSLNFGIGYQQMTGTREILTRMAVVRTMCQIPEVEYVSFLVGSNPLMDSKETPIGPMNAESFVENPGSTADDYAVTTATLYFANKSGDRLVEETVNISYSSNISVERVVVEQLINGPITEDAYPTIPPETKLISISTKDGICYVNLDNGFLSQGYDVTEAVPVYSIVNSLTGLPGISRVQILINGETDLVYRESIRFDTIFERNLDLVEDE